MVRKVALLLLVLTGIIPTACCPEPPSGPYLLHFGSISLYEEGYVAKYLEPHKEYILSSTEPYTQDTLVLQLGFDYSFAQNNINFKLHSAAMALSCDEDPHLTRLNDKITDITITSNMPFNEVEPGQQLNAKVQVFDREINSLIPLGQAIDLINSINGYETMDRRLNILAITEKPTGTFEHTFRVAVTYESGKEDVSESAPIIW